MPQGKSLGVGIKGKPPPHGNKFDLVKLAANETDERYQYLLKRAIIRRVEDEDKIIFAELPGLPGVLVVYRKPSERNANPERLNLDRRDLSQMPLLEGEERLRLLNYQHNYISKIENLLSLPNLIFLDLYNNQIKEIASLHTVPTLRVLMLGKNQIDKIKNLQALTKLDVLDLHSNKISKIENLSHLSELRVLNLANNQISLIENIEGLLSLTELNLRRNQIPNIKGLERLPKLQRLFLSNNRIEKLESIDSLSQCSQLTELALDANGIHGMSNYLSYVLKACAQLKYLDLNKVTQEMKTQSSQNTSLGVYDPNNTSESNQYITAISQEFQSEIKRIMAKGLNFYRRRKESPSECLIQSGHAELEGENKLFIYGNALEVLSDQRFQETVDEIFCQYVRFDYFVQHSFVSKLRKFSKLNKLAFSDNNLHSFIQLSKLECLPALTQITIENNDVLHSVLWKSFIVYRFPSIVEINDVAVTETDRVRARQQFQTFDRILCNPSLFVSFT